VHLLQPCHANIAAATSTPMQQLLPQQQQLPMHLLILDINTAADSLALFPAVGHILNTPPQPPPLQPTSCNHRSFNHSTTSTTCNLHPLQPSFLSSL
jgi:hypothetical protein